MLDYLAVKKHFADKLANDADGIGRFESAFFHTMKFVYEQGVEDGKQVGHGDPCALSRIGIEDRQFVKPTGEGPHE